MGLIITNNLTKRQKRIEHAVHRILLEKEKMDTEHIKKAARLGCGCRLCKAARNKP